jgi:4-hydroxybenzoate polyprenyltransferase
MPPACVGSSVRADSCTIINSTMPVISILHWVGILLAAAPPAWAYLGRYTGNPFPRPGWEDAGWAALVTVAALGGAVLTNRRRSSP